VFEIKNGRLLLLLYYRFSASFFHSSSSVNRIVMLLIPEELLQSFSFQIPIFFFFFPLLSVKEDRESNIFLLLTTVNERLISSLSTEACIEKQSICEHKFTKQTFFIIHRSQPFLLFKTSKRSSHSHSSSSLQFPFVYI
jgi:hypothetical protein